MSASSTGELAIGDVGSFGELSAKSNPDGLALVYIPGLAALLERARQLKGADLSEAEAARIAERAGVMAVTPGHREGDDQKARLCVASLLPQRGVQPVAQRDEVVLHRR